ncbi:MAG: 30S ribosomal protein S12 methylthiotransferase RimO [Deltaproteobacteria bacterium]|nr:30S ribosomal protein S12 methylthiotransferase RimO [Deltaproteobacteria bacterium]
MTTRTVHFVTLGCPKNIVDSERMHRLAADQGISAVDDPAAAEVIVVNTCGFIEAAKQESIDTILKMAEYKQQGTLQALIVAGCLSQRYPEELARELPEVDHFLGTTDFATLREILAERERRRQAVGQPLLMNEQEYRRQLIGPPHSAYLKISEGCDRPCAFCSIPLMRGKQRSRTIDSLVEEARTLAESGVVELILVAQDSTAYGRDLEPSVRLTDLLRALDQVQSLEWIRLHYAYPSMISEALAQTIAGCQRVIPYLDLPIQHVDDTVLRRMRRGYTEQVVRERLEILRKHLPEVVIRTTFLLGHPGETDRAHQRLLSFLQDAELDNVGAFVFSAEDGTAALDQPDPVSAEVAEQRRQEVMALQQQISRNKLRRRIGQRLKVMVDGISAESEFLLEGRYYGQSPEIDGTVTITDAARCSPGTILEVQITDSADYDLVGSAAPA